MKTVKILTLTVLLLVFNACNKTECAYDEDEHGCVPLKPNTNRAGMTVATCYAKTPTGDVAVIYQTQNNSTAPIGDDWGNPLTGTAVTAIHPTNWRVDEIGQVFGIAIDDRENIYLAASHVYAQNILPTPAQNTVPGRIYKCTEPTWTAVPFFDIPNSGVGTLNGTGNIAYDKANNQLFVTNLEDGKIYKYNMAGVQTGVFDPWTADVASNGIVGQDERVWGIGVNYENGVVKVYFPRITSAGVRSIYSIDLTSTGAFPTGVNPEIMVVNNVPGNQAAITDIAFSSDTNKMLIAERGNPHSAKTLSFVRNGASWTFDNQYYVGGKAGTTAPDGENAAGGVDFAYGEVNGNVSANCDEFFWSTGNYMNANNIVGRIYGLQGMKFTGNNSESFTPINQASKNTDLFIDLNSVYSTTDKNGVGDVEVFDADQCYCEFN